MKDSFAILFALFVVTFMLSLPVAYSQAIKKSVKTSTPKLIWADEFNNDGPPDPAKWGYDTGAGGWGNAELEYYTDRVENAVIDKGVLKINAIKEDYKGSPYTSARLLSKHKFSFKYGRVEARAKLPAGVGTWPAIWMLGENIDSVGWPGCGEIDIMEQVGRELNKIYGTLHYPKHSGGKANGKTIMIKNASTEFHLYALDWSPKFIKISVDNTVYQVVPNSAGIPFNQNFFLLLNVAMGGNFGGPMDPAITRATMEVDYIRVFK